MDEKHDSVITIRVEGMQQLLGIAMGISQALNVSLQNEEAIMAAIAAINSGDPAATAKAVADLNSARATLKARTDALAALIQPSPQTPLPPHPFPKPAG